MACAQTKDLPAGAALPCLPRLCRFGLSECQRAHYYRAQTTGPSQQHRLTLRSLQGWNRVHVTTKPLFKQLTPTTSELPSAIYLSQAAN